ncbi:MAG: ATP-binding cassette domain-containing protein [Glaciecola sp.]|jgi:sulfonate transport system ATP-binding protein|nr:ATP-binding cassette domain-containing protein [Glaciecola sp.]MDG1814798.1 ATP-binding cassette domain-containing protein [Glaciecola sp.]MDG2098943.1 ATP-binding cassette domain-containing protein [Glaciecola sp.]
MSALRVNITQLAYRASQHSALSQSAATSQTSDYVIADITLDIQHNECVCIVGPSGCGKTTLLNAVAGILDTNTSANVELAFTTPSPTIGYIFQEPRLMPWLTLYENIALVMPKADPRKITAILDAVGLTAQANSYPNHLSGGMQRRASIARAFIIEPDILLLDEPFVSLDAPTAMQCRELLISLAKRHKTTILFVTHDLNEALYLGDRVVFLSPSPARIIHELALNNLYKAYDSAAQTNLKSELFTRFPKILEGQLSKD